ncbi:YfgM family protein [Herbaspirillum frisingense]|uniref:YfgM family protein n=1 Tax=Herbaspirillum frisingense TaxID=92645 RepID=UPI001F19B1CC|nr:tetratricopeptide repeat protein [Herbaspirillum frisingense]UIN19760.1 tetratricopeptide repeat protein [Herbaspirillum frisingense]
MAYDLEEQEQLDSIKAWWAKYGNLVTWALIIALAAYAAWTGWNTYQARQSGQASVLYEEQQKSFAAKDNAKVQRAASDIQDKFSGTAYAEMSALVAARSAFDANDIETAKKQLQWVIDHGRGKEYKAIAAVRLAGVLLDAKSYDEALNLLSGDYPAQFAGAIADRKGDVLLAQGKRDEARTAYKLALEKSDAKDPGRQLIQIKLDAIGGEAPKA